jgi:hypothetical protein
MNYPRVASFKTVEQFRERLGELKIELPVDEQILDGRSSPLGQPMRVGNFMVGNRFCIHPMEGWDATADGRPSELTLRRWRRFGGSGAKLIWGGEAAAVRHDGQAMRTMRRPSAPCGRSWSRPIENDSAPRRTCWWACS